MQLGGHCTSSFCLFRLLLVCFRILSLDSFDVRQVVLSGLDTNAFRAKGSNTQTTLRMPQKGIRSGRKLGFFVQKQVHSIVFSLSQTTSQMISSSHRRFFRPNVLLSAALSAGSGLNATAKTVHWPTWALSCPWLFPLQHFGFLWLLFCIPHSQPRVVRR